MDKRSSSTAPGAAQLDCPGGRGDARIGVDRFGLAIDAAAAVPHEGPQ